jgi:hypothetical protein
VYLIFAFIELLTPSPVAGTEDANDALPVAKSDGEDTTANRAKAEVALFSGAMRRVLRDNPLGVSKRELSHRERNAVFKLILAVLCRVPLESGFGHSSILRLRQTKSHTYIWLRGEQPLDRMACWWWEACLLGIVDCVASPAEPHVEHAGINRYEETGHEPQV